MGKTKNAFYAQSGGVTAVINASACGVIETARQHRQHIGKVFAGRHGIIGALTEDLIDTSKESASAIAALKTTPSGAFGSCRYKLKSLEENRAQYQRLIDVFKAHNIGYFSITAAAIRQIPVLRYRNFPRPQVIRSRPFIFPKPSTMICRLPTTVRVLDP